jgi:nicotinamide mononucleotide adenylyltransferase
MECDIDHGLIEKQKKKLQTPVSHAYDWYQLVCSVGKTKNFKVAELTFQDFIDFSSLQKTLFFRKVIEEGELFHWQRRRVVLLYPRITGNSRIKQTWRKTNHSGS